MESVTFSKVAGLSNTHAWYFSRFLSCAKATKSRNASHILYLVTEQIKQKLSTAISKSSKNLIKRK